MKKIDKSKIEYFIDNDLYLNIQLDNKTYKSSKKISKENTILNILTETLKHFGYILKLNDDIVYTISFSEYGNVVNTSVKKKYIYLQENRNCIISNPTDVIVKSILKNWEDKKKQNMFYKKDILEIVSGTPQICLYTKPMNELVDGNIVEPKMFIYDDGETAYENEFSLYKISDNEIKITYAANWGQKMLTHYYKIDSLVKDNVVYVPIEIKRNGKKIEYHIIEGIYSDIKTAQRVLKKSSQTDCMILIQDAEKMIHQEWYKNLIKSE